MNKKFFLLLSFVIFTTGCVGSTPQQTIRTDVIPTDNEVIIEIGDSRFSPRSVTVNAGDTVTFINVGTAATWPATNVHPSHTLYPGSSITKCQGSGASTIFDACRRLNSGESYSFIFNQQGNWEYHDHVRSYLTGTITVR